MEKVRMALEKAQAERMRIAAEAPAGVATAGASPAATAARLDASAPADIHYSKTPIRKPREETLEHNRVIGEEVDPDYLAAFKMLRTQILQRMKTRGWNTLGVTSPSAGDGKTLTALNLAISLARELHHTVLLCDLDMRHPSLHRILGLELEHGVEDYLFNNVPLQEVLVNPGIERLVILPCLRPVSNSSEVLSSRMMSNLVQELKSRYPERFVLFDLPPVLQADDALSFSPLVDAFLLVLREAKTTAQEVEMAVEVLKDATILGTVLNDSFEKVRAYY